MNQDEQDHALKDALKMWSSDRLKAVVNSGQLGWMNKLSSEILIERQRSSDLLINALRGK